MAKWDSPNIAILMMVALQPPHFSIAVYSPATIVNIHRCWANISGCSLFVMSVHTTLL